MAKDNWRIDPKVFHAKLQTKDKGKIKCFSGDNLSFSIPLSIIL